MDKRIVKRNGVRRLGQFLLIGLMLSQGLGLVVAEPPSAGPSRDKLLELLDDANAYRRAYAVYNVAYRIPEDVPKLVRFISDADASVRRAAIFSLGLLRFGQETERFLNALKDPHYGVRRAAVFALGNIQSREALEGVAQALKDDDAVVRRLAVLGLARADVKTSVPRLISLLRDESPRVRRAAACALGVLGDRSALDPLKRLYRDPRSSEPSKPMLAADEKVREALRKKHNLDYKFLHFMDTLDRLSQAAEVEIRVDDEVLFLLNTSASDPENLNSIRLAMWNVPFERALAKIVDTMGAYYYVESGTINISSKRYQDYDTPVALEVAGAMASLGDRSAVADVRKFLENPQFRKRARQLLRAVTGR